MSTQGDALFLIEELETAVSKFANGAKTLLGDTKHTGARSGMPMPDIGDDITPTVELTPLPFTPEELKAALDDAEVAIRTASREEQSAKRAILIIGAATKLLPLVAGLL